MTRGPIPRDISIDKLTDSFWYAKQNDNTEQRSNEC